MEAGIFTMMTLGLTIGLSITYILPRRKEIMGNWGKYRTDPFMMFGAPFFKPDDDPRSTAQFAEDNFKDVMNSLADRIFGVFLQPVFELFSIFTSSLNSIMTNLFAFRDLMKHMFAAFLRIFEPFMARFRIVTHQLRKTFLHLKDAIGRVAATATAAIFAGISTLRTMMNMFELMKTVATTIVLVLGVLVIWFWFLLWPLAPLVILAIGALGSAGVGGPLADIASAFCFGPDTQIQLQNGTTMPISSIPLGAVLKEGAVVEATMKFQTAPHPFYTYKGVVVSGSHIVYEPTPGFVKDSVHATPTPAPPVYYCLQTSTRRISVQSSSGDTIEFADWEELEEEDDTSLREWYATVEKMLNGIVLSASYPTSMLMSDPVFAGSTLIQTPVGLRSLASLQPGDYILNADAAPIKVLGVVRMDSSRVAESHSMGKGELSCACWVRPPGYTHWKPIHTFSRMFPPSTPSTSPDPWMSLFTEDGTFLLGGGWGVRDFTEVGPDHIQDTHPETLRILKQQSK
jgi:hypothetical protein